MQFAPAVQLTDFYKTGHFRQYPDYTFLIGSNLTARSSRFDDLNYAVFFGLQAFMKFWLIEHFNDSFFARPKEEVVAEYKELIEGALGPDAITFDHIAALHDKQYLPLRIRALAEGTKVPLQVPMLVIENTEPEFYWLTNYVETLMSCELWKPCTTAAIAHSYRKVFDQYAELTGADKGFVGWQGHDFSFRGMSGVADATINGAAHLLSFTGTDTVPSIWFLKNIYKQADGGFVGGSVPATEHSVMCAGGADDEEGTYDRLITDVYPTGIVSIVSDTWDFWAVVTQLLPKFKDKIMERKGKVVIRPDSGDPVKIICGDPEAPTGSPENSGLIACLWKTFGGTITHKGYKVLDSHIGAIYGDSITRERQLQILQRLMAAGFASSNIVLGIGSFTYNYLTRDSLGMAVKSTYCNIGGKEKQIYKKPKTDSGKNSARGRIKVVRNAAGVLEAKYPVTAEEENQPDNLLVPVFENSRIIRHYGYGEIRARLAAEV